MGELPTRRADPVAPAFETKPCAYSTKSPFQLSGISILYRPPSYVPKKAFAPASASNFGSPGCHSWVGHGSGATPGRPTATVVRVVNAAASSAAIDAQVRARIRIVIPYRPAGYF